MRTSNFVYSAALQAIVFYWMSWGFVKLSDGAIGLWPAFASILAVRLVFEAIDRAVGFLLWRMEGKPVAVHYFLNFLRQRSMPTAETGWGLGVHNYVSRIEHGHDWGLVKFSPECVAAAKGVEAVVNAASAVSACSSDRLLEALSTAIEEYGKECGAPQTIEELKTELARKRSLQDDRDRY